jgi:hypothetical protein
MARTNNPELGTVKCGEPGCGRTCTVHQAKRGKGRYLYTRNSECGDNGCCDQRTGKTFQDRLKRETVWRDGCKPEGIELDDWTPSKPEKPVVTDQGEPKAKPAAEPKQQPKGGSGIFVGVSVLLAGVAGFFALKGKKSSQSNQQPGGYNGFRDY